MTIDRRKVIEECDDEISKAKLGRIERRDRMKYPGQDAEKLKHEQDEFYAKELMFEDIKRLCQGAADEVLLQSIIDKRKCPRCESDVIDWKGFGPHWENAFQYAIKQCGIILDVDPQNSA